MAGADKSLTLQVVTTADSGGLTQTQASLAGISAEVKTLTANFSALTAAAQAASAAVSGSMGAAGAGVKDTGGGRSWTLPTDGGSGGGASPGASYPSFGPTPIPGNPSAGEAQVIIDLKRQLAEANAKVAKSEAEAAEAMKKGAGAATTGAGATKIVIDAKDKSVKSEEEATKATEEGTAAQEEGAGTLVDATQMIVDAHDKKKKAAQEGAEADDHAAEGSKKVGQGAVTAAQFLQDMQYGIGAVSNQLPQLLTGLGMGAGMAGGLSIVGVFLELAIKNLDLFGGEVEASGKAAQQTAAQLHELYVEQRNAATAAADQAKQSAAAEESMRRQKQLADDAADAYGRMADNIERATRAKEAQNRAAIAETDAALAAELANIAADRAQNKITEGEAIQKSALAKKMAEDQKFKVDQRNLDEQKKALEDKAREAENEAAAQRYAARNLNENINGLLPEEQAKTIEDRVKTAETRFHEAKKKYEETPELGVVEFNDVSGEYITGPNPERPKRQAEMNKYSKEFQDLRKQQEDHDDAVQRSGVKSQEEARDAMAKANKAAFDQEANRSKMLQDAGGISQQIDSNQRVYNQKKIQMDADERAQKGALAQRQLEEANRREDEAIKKRRDKEDEANREKWDNLKKSPPPSPPDDDPKERRFNSRSGRIKGAGRKKWPISKPKKTTSNASVYAEQQKEEARQLKKTRDAEDEALKAAREKAKRDQLQAPDPQGAPAYPEGPWEGPTVTGFPGGYPTPPPAEGAPQQRKEAMDGLSRMPDTQDAASAAKSAEAAAGAFQSYHETIMSKFRAIDSAQSKLEGSIRNAEGQIKELRYGR